LHREENEINVYCINTLTDVLSYIELQKARAKARNGAEGKVKGKKRTE